MRIGTDNGGARLRDSILYEIRVKYTEKRFYISHGTHYLYSVHQKALETFRETVMLIELSKSGYSRRVTESGNGLLHFDPSAWSDGHCPLAARSHSFVYISTS